LFATETSAGNNKRQIERNSGEKIQMYTKTDENRSYSKIIYKAQDGVE